MSRRACLLNIGGYWDPMIEQIRRGAREHFIHERQADLVAVADTVAEALEIIDRPPDVLPMAVEEKL